MPEATVQDRDKPVGESPQGVVVVLAEASMTIVIRTCSGGRRQRCERPQVAGVEQSFVASVASEDDPVLA